MSLRDSSIKEQVLVAPRKKEEVEVKTAAINSGVQQKTEAPVSTSTNEEDVESGDLMTKTSAKHEICPECGSKTQIQEGCVSCKGCGWALCK